MNLKLKPPLHIFKRLSFQLKSNYLRDENKCLNLDDNFLEAAGNSRIFSFFKIMWINWMELNWFVNGLYLTGINLNRMGRNYRYTFRVTFPLMDCILG